jgi:RND family efflux transporter MFP subunit
MIKKILKFLLITLLVVGVATAAGLYILGEPGAIAVVHPVRGPAVQAVYATGTVEPSVMLPIAPRASSRLMELLADEGSRVEKDEVLARLEDTDIRKELADMQARADLAQKDYDRKAALVESGAVSRQSFDQAKTELQSSRAAVDKIKASLSYLTLLAPDDGMVIRRDGEIGELITGGQPVFWLAGEAMRVSAEVDEEDIALVEPGQKVLIRADAFPGEVFDGTVQSITPKGDPVARSYRVRITLSDDTKLMTGMTAESNIVIREDKDALLLPASTVKDKTVWIVKNNAFEKRSVKTGAQNKDMIEILDGVIEKDLVVKKPPPDIQEGEEIKIRMGEWKVRP